MEGGIFFDLKYDQKEKRWWMQRGAGKWVVQRYWIIE